MSQQMTPISQLSTINERRSQSHRPVCTTFHESKYSFLRVLNWIDIESTARLAFNRSLALFFAFSLDVLWLINFNLIYSSQLVFINLRLVFVFRGFFFFFIPHLAAHTVRKRHEKRISKERFVLRIRFSYIFADWFRYECSLRRSEHEFVGGTELTFIINTRECESDDDQRARAILIWFDVSFRRLLMLPNWPNRWKYNRWRHFNLNFTAHTAGPHALHIRNICRRLWLTAPDVSNQNIIFDTELVSVR